MLPYKTIDVINIPVGTSIGLSKKQATMRSTSLVETAPGIFHVVGKPAQFKAEEEIRLDEDTGKILVKAKKVVPVVDLADESSSDESSSDESSSDESSSDESSSDESAVEKVKKRVAQRRKPKSK